MCDRSWYIVEGLTLIACSPSTPNLRASQACITAQNALSQVVFSLAKRLEKREKKIVVFLIALLTMMSSIFFNYQNKRTDLQRSKAAF